MLKWDVSGRGRRQVVALSCIGLISHTLLKLIEPNPTHLALSYIPAVVNTLREYIPLVTTSDHSGVNCVYFVESSPALCS